MSIAVAMILFVLILLLYGFLSSVFTVLFRLTGMPEDKARFQVTSLLTGTGYTTSESEAIMNDKHRRDLAQKTMLFGYVFNVTVLSAIVNLVYSFKASELEAKLWTAPLPVLLIALVIYLRRDPRVKLWLDAQVQGLAAHIMDKAPGNRLMVMDSYGRSVMAQLHLAAVPPQLRGKALKDTQLRAQGVSVVLVRRHGQQPLQPDGDTLLADGDHLVVVGSISSIEEAFELERTTKEK